MSYYVAFHPSYIHAVPENHRFPMEKYALIHQQLIYEGLVTPGEFIEPDIIDLKWVELAHHKEYIQKLVTLSCSPREQRVSGFIHNNQLIERELRIAEATRLCAEKVVRNGGIALNIAGGTHHAYADKGEGFCLLNDQAIAAAYLINQRLVERILIVDLDVHQGNGTAAIFHSEPRVFTFSMHGKDNYPLHKEQSDLDIALDTGIDDEKYLSILQDVLPKLIAFNQPDMVFYQCGVDVLQTDKLGKLGLTHEGIKKRDQLVLELAHRHQLPLVCTMGGGYSKHIRDIVNAHMHVFRLGNYLFQN